MQVAWSVQGPAHVTGTHWPQKLPFGQNSPEQHSVDPPAGEPSGMHAPQLPGTVRQTQPGPRTVQVA
jgi:hypothetical protein